MGRSPCCSQVGLRKGPWSTEEDYLLTSYIQLRGEGQWRSVPKNAGLLRCGKSCRLRWLNYLRPGIKRGNISEDEEDLIVRLHKLLGNRWSLIAGRLPGRTDNEIKNHWNTHLLKKLKSSGVDEDLLKPTKTKQPASAAPTDKKKKKKKKKKTVATTISNNDINPPKTKVYRPKAIRVSPLFLGTSNSYDDSLASETSINNGGDAAKKVASYMQVALSPLFELEDTNYYGVHGSGRGQEDDFMGDGRILPVLRHSDPTSCDVNMLQKVYDEYLQLL